MGYLCIHAQDTALVTDSGIGTLAMLCPRLARLVLARLPAVRGAFLAPLLRRCGGALTHLELDALPAFSWAELPAGPPARALDWLDPHHGPGPNPNPNPDQGSSNPNGGRGATRALPRLRALRLAGVHRGVGPGGGQMRHSVWLERAGSGGGGGEGEGANAAGAVALLVRAPALTSLEVDGPPRLVEAAVRWWCARLTKLPPGKALRALTEGVDTSDLALPGVLFNTVHPWPGMCMSTGEHTRM